MILILNIFYALIWGVFITGIVLTSTPYYPVAKYFLIGGLFGIFWHFIIGTASEKIPRFSNMQYFCITIFAFGLLFKYQHYDSGSGFFMFMGTLLFMGTNVAYYMANYKSQTGKTLFYFPLSLWLIYISIRLMYFPSYWLCYCLAVIASVLYLYVVFRSKKDSVSKMVIIVVCIIAGFFANFIPTNRIFYVIHKQEFVYNPPVSLYKSYLVWDEYSEYLYEDGLRTEALEANRKTIDFVSRMNMVYRDKASILSELQNKRLRMQRGTWERSNNKYE